MPANGDESFYVSEESFLQERRITAKDYVVFLLNVVLMLLVVADQVGLYFPQTGSIFYLCVVVSNIGVFAALVVQSHRLYTEYFVSLGTDGRSLVR